MPAKSSKVLTGTLLFNRRGGGARLIGPNDKLIAWLDGGETANALHGDSVEAVATRSDMARVTKVLARGRDEIVGTYQRQKGAGQKGIIYLVPDDPRIPCDILIRPGGPALSRPPRVGDKVLVKLEPWKGLNVSPAGQIVELLGAPGDPGVDMLSVIRTYDLAEEFPPAVDKEAHSFPLEVPADEIRKREDCRGEFVLTIDPDDAKDHDDAICVQPLRNGWLLSVHIADVAHFVRPGSALDREARQRGNSTYLADRCIPMLPLRLSADLCSLREGVDRLAHTAFVEFSTEGKIKKVRFAKTIIRVAKRLTYREAKRLLDKPLPRSGAKDKVHEAIHTAWKLASLLRKHRFAAGSLDLEFPEVKIFLDAKGDVDRIEKIDNDESHQLIEEFMLVANEVVAREIKNRTTPCIYRVHEKPDPERLDEFRQLAATQGLKMGDLKVRKEVQKMLASLAGRLDSHKLKIEFLKSLRRAAYSPDPMGHYGLSKSDYLHFTSPIRRYADLIAHRVLAREKGKSRKELAEIAEHISETERNSASAEQDSKLIKKMQFFLRQLAEKKTVPYKAIVSEPRANGLLVEVTDVDTLGFVPTSMIPGGPYEFDRARGLLYSRRGGKRFKTGDFIQVKVCRVDPAQRQIDFAIVA